MLNTEGSGFNRFIDAIREIADIAPVAMIYGTPAHDTDGSLEVFRKVTSKYGITVLDPGQPYFLAEVNGRGKVVQEIPGVSGKAVIFGIPEPRKKYLLAENSAGKDETEEAIRSAMHRMCYLLAAKRKEYADIPCIVLYHGEVAGTVYQNDLTVERGTGIAITIDDLADIGADYYALGHIHKPQKVGNINAYYSGSIYPKNFGETHQASFKIVDIESTIENQRLTSVNTVDLPHPQNMKIEASFNDWRQNPAFALGTPKCKLDLKGKRVWLEIKCTKEERAFLFEPDVEAQCLFDNGAVEGSRVTVCDIPVETVRAAEIADVNTPPKKFEVWAKNSSVEVLPSHIEKIEALNAEITKNDVKPEGAWELVSLRLKGSVGIMRGIKKEQIFVCFENYANGLIALSGPNGKGKTTCIENCHPYPQLFTRKGKLQDHFFLKDSFREVIYRNHADGSMWKFLIQIDGQNKSGSCKYFIFKQTAGLAGAEWEPLPGVDGNLKPYEEALGAIFGPVELFRRTAFITQKATKDLPDITDATAGEKKTLFIALAGIDYLQGFSDNASEKAKLEAAKTHDAEIKMQVLQAAIDKKPQEERVLKDTEAVLKSKNAELAEITKQGKTTKADVDRHQAAWSAEQVRQQQENDAKASVDTIHSEIKKLVMDIDTHTEAAENKARYESDIAEYEAQQKIIDTETANRQKFTEAVLKKQQDYAKAKAAYDKNLKALEAERDTLCDQRSDTEHLVEKAESNIRLAERDEEVERNRMLKPLSDRKAEIDSLILTARKNIELYERDAAEIADDCPTCGQALPEDKLAELKARREEYVRKISAEKASIEALEAEVTDIGNKTSEAIQKAADQREGKIAKENAEIKTHNGKIAELNNRVEAIDLQISELAFDEPASPSAAEFDGRKLWAAREKQQSINIAKIRAALVQAQEAAVRIEGLQKQLAGYHKRLEVKEAEYAKVRQAPEFGAKIKHDLDSATARHTELTTKYTAVKSEIAGLEAAITAVKKNIAEIAEKEKEYSVLNYDSQLAKVEGQEWELISKAFGKDGIQALELDALAPGISDTANRILESAYGDRFRIEIRTTRLGGAGKKTKQIEDFLIYVIDSEDGEAVLLDDKSGGEAVWIKRAIYDAFAVIRKRNTNFSFLTCFQDETDGALDSAAKTSYCRMLEAAHAESKLRNTIIITHSNEVKAMIEQKIDMEALAA
jgi:exonuclease SbcC